jgi:hypothetical protein
MARYFTSFFWGSMGIVVKIKLCQAIFKQNLATINRVIPQRDIFVSPSTCKPDLGRHMSLYHRKMESEAFSRYHTVTA